MNDHFVGSMNETEGIAWISFVLVKNFMGNHKAENYVKSRNNSFRQLGSNMNVKVHNMHSHLNGSLENIGKTCEEHEERYPQDKEKMDECSLDR
ncbi:hypothetical protein AVEN_203606-1 [Araneus ventricosus]|uniref:Uncharacterized protein n=1 Tax=Araneus ventricosus TaxID=182803 RepID=A0A4Y2JDL8_ARAVE|nr:hypothetical protein AVEN_203606-1 [Araneus ventricosus]